MAGPPGRRIDCSHCGGRTRIDSNVLIDGTPALCGGCIEEIREDLRRHRPTPRLFGQTYEMRKWIP